MKYIRMLCALMCTVVLCSSLLCPIAAKAGVDALTYTYTDEASEVDTQTVFLTVFDTEKDIEIIGERAAWYFYYENIHRSTNTWAPFSTAVTVKAASNAPLVSTLAGTDAYIVDLRDGDAYPGPAELHIPIADITGNGAFHLYTYEEAEDGTPLLTALATHLLLDGDGAFTVTVTSAHDFLLVPATASPDVLNEFLAATVIKEDSFFSGASLPWILFFAAIGLLLILLCIYVVTVKILKAKRKRK